MPKLWMETNWTKCKQNKTKQNPPPLKTEQKPTTKDTQTKIKARDLYDY